MWQSQTANREGKSELRREIGRLHDCTRVSDSHNGVDAHMHTSLAITIGTLNASSAASPVEAAATDLASFAAFFSAFVCASAKWRRALLAPRSMAGAAERAESADEGAASAGHATRANLRSIGGVRGKAVCVR